MVRVGRNRVDLIDGAIHVVTMFLHNVLHVVENILDFPFFPSTID